MYVKYYHVSLKKCIILIYLYFIPYPYTIFFIYFKRKITHISILSIFFIPNQTKYYRRTPSVPTNPFPRLCLFFQTPLPFFASTLTFTLNPHPFKMLMMLFTNSITCTPQFNKILDFFAMMKHYPTVVSLSNRLELKAIQPDLFYFEHPH